MLRKYRTTMIITSAVTLLPIPIGLILWKKLPEIMATHFGADNTPNGWSSKAFTVFGLPLIILALHWVCMLVTSVDPKSKNISAKSMNMVLWICPSVSVVVNSLVYAYTVNNELRIGFIVLLFMGVLFMVMGNYLPKSKQNFTFGIKTPWTLNDEENWNKTHRLAGKIWVIGGAAVCLTSFLESPVVMIGILIVMAAVPYVYSYRIYKSKKEE